MSITIRQTDEMIEVREDGELIAFVEKDMLHVVGIAEPICSINHRTEIVGKLMEWRKKQRNLLT